MYEICIGCPHLGSQGNCRKNANRQAWTDIGQCPWRCVPVEEETLHATTGTPAALIVDECDSVKALLLAKNAKYGNSALEPKRVFSKASPVEQLLVRIDDKISRIQTTGTSAPDEDTLMDLIGYLVLLKVAMRGTP